MNNHQLLVITITIKYNEITFITDKKLQNNSNIQQVRKVSQSNTCQYVSNGVTYKMFHQNGCISAILNFEKKNTLHAQALHYALLHYTNNELVISKCFPFTCSNIISDRDERTDRQMDRQTYMYRLNVILI